MPSAFRPLGSRGLARNVAIANPVELATHPHATVATEPTATIVLLVAALAGLGVLKRGEPLDLRTIAKYGAVAIGFVIVGNVVPGDLVIWILAAALAYWILTNEPGVAELVARASRAIPG